MVKATAEFLTIILTNLLTMLILLFLFSFICFIGKAVPGGYGHMVKKVLFFQILRFIKSCLVSEKDFLFIHRYYWW